MLLAPTAHPYCPRIEHRVELSQRRKVSDFRTEQENGTVFLPLKEEVPWKRTIPIVDTSISKNYKGIRVAAVNRADEPGFPTPFR